MVYGELGRYPLNIHINVRMIGFWLKLKISNKLSSNVYQLLFTLKESKDLRFKWLDHIFKICNSTGMNYLLDSKELESSHQCIKLQFKRILQDQFIQSWFSDMNNGNNRRRNDRSLRDWHHNDKTDLRLYLLGTNRNSKKKQNIEAGLK